MKKILTLLLVLILSVSTMVGCDKIPFLGDLLGDLLPDNTEHEHSYVDGKCECGEKDPNYVPPHEHTFVEGKCECGAEDPNYVPPVEEDADLRAAYDFIHQSAKEVAKETGASYDLPTAAKIGDKIYTVVWTVSSDLITLTPSEKVENVVTVNIPRVYENTDYTIKFTVTNEKGEKLEREYSHVIPAFKVSTFDEYMAAKTGDTLVVKGIVVAINSKAAGNTRNHLFLADENVVGGYYSYQMDQDPVADLGIEVGMTVLVTGPAAPYSGMMEIKGGVAEIVSTEKKTVEFVDVSADFAAGDSLAKYTALPVVIKGVTIGGQELGGTSEYLKFSLNGKESYIRTYVTDFPTTLKAEDKATIDADHAAHYGYTADVYGIVVLFSNKPYLIPMSVDCFKNYKEVERTPAEKIAASVENVTVTDKIKEDTVLELPLEGLYDGVTISWTVDSTAVSFIEDGKLEVKLGEVEVTLTLTATFTCGDVTETKEYKVLVDAASTQQYITKPTSEVKEGVAYKFGLVQGTLGETLYLTGEVSGRYLVTTKYLDEAADVYVEAVENSYKFYILVEDVKQYITVYNNADNKLSVKFDAEGTSVYAYNATVNAWVTNMDGTDYYLGTYNNFNTVSASKLSYITAENTGVSQFPANFYRYEFVADEPACTHANTTTTTVDATCTAAGSTTVTCDDCGETVSTTELPKLDHTYVDGACSCGAKDPATIPTDPSAQNTANVVFGDLGWQNSVLYESVEIDANIGATVTGTAVGNYSLNSGKYYTTGAGWRIYQTENGQITITAANGATIVSVKVTYTVDKGGVLTKDGANVDSDSVVVVNATSVTFGIANTGTATNGQVRISALEVIYVGGSAVDPKPETPAHTCADANGDYTCDAEDCKKVVAPAADSTLTIPQAIALANALGANNYTTNKYYITATIVDVYNTEYGNMNVKDADGNTYVFYGAYDTAGNRYDAMATKPVAGDTLTIYGVVGSYQKNAESSVSYQIKNGTVTALNAANPDQGGNNGNTETDSNALQYTISQYTAGTQYAENEVHNLDDNTTVTVTQGHFTTQLRLYSSSEHDAFAVIHSVKAVTKLSVNAGNKADNLVVYGSNDGTTWVEIGKIATSSSYADYTLDLNGSYNYIKLDVEGSNQVRVASFTLTVA